MAQNIYTIQLDGKQYDLQGDHPPTEQEARSAISQQQPQAPAQQQAPKPQLSPFQKAGDIAQSFNSTLLGGLLRGGANVAKVVLPQSAKSKLDTAINKYDPNYQPQTQAGKVAATAGNVSRDIATGVGSLLLPGASAAQRVASGAVLGAERGLEKSGAKNRTTGQQIGSGIKGGIYGALATWALEGTAYLAKQLSGITGKGIANAFVKTPVTTDTAGQEQIGQGLAQRGITGSYRDMITGVQDHMNNYGQQLNDVIQANADKPVDMGPVVDSLNSLQKKLASTPGESTSGADLVMNELRPYTEGGVTVTGIAKTADGFSFITSNGEKIPSQFNTVEEAQQAMQEINDFKKTGQLSLARAQQLKQNLQDAVNTGFQQENTVGVRQAQKDVAQTLRNQIEKAVPEVAPINKELTWGYNAIDALVKQANQSPNKYRILVELGASLGGLMVGNPIPAAATVTERALTSPRVAMPAAGALVNASQSTLPSGLRDLLQRLASAAAGKR